MKKEELFQALSIFADVLRAPTLPPEQMEDARAVCLQELRALEDDLPQQAIIALRKRFYGEPLGRIAEGDLNGVEEISIDDVKAFVSSYYRPNEMILAVAGNFDFEKVRDHVGKILGDWKPKQVAEPLPLPARHGIHHIEYESHQTHIAIAYEGVPYSDPDFFRHRAAIGVLSDGMSSRLFHEVREKRGLCYSVFASCHSVKDSGAVICYSGTTAERAQETLDVILEQLVLLYDGISTDELERLKVQIRSGLIMQQESSRSRASSIAGDWFHLGRVRSLDEINQEIDGLTESSINEFLQAHRPNSFDLVTLGPAPLEIKDGISKTSA